MKINQVVQFTDNVKALAGVFCRDNGISAVIDSINETYYTVDAGLGYSIYVQANEIVPAPDGTVPKVDRNGRKPDQKLIPPNDGGI